MGTQLWQVKLRIPPLRPGSVARPRLLRRLDEALHSKLTLLSAPAGYGKTTLLNQWIESVRAGRSDPPQFAWLSLDAEDNDPSRFTTYFASALRTVPSLDRQGVAQAIVSRLEGDQQARPQVGSVNDLVIALLNQVDELGQDVVFVLDDYYLVTAEAIHAALSVLLRHLPPRLHLVVATRADPPLPLASLRGQDQLVELRLADLRFTDEEAAGYLNDVLELGLSPDDVAALARRTEGWIAGLHMAAVSLQGREDPSAYIESFAGSDRYVMDYLMQEVLERQPEPLHDFLLRTAILDRLSGSLCDAVTGRDDSQAVLEGLERDNLFIVPLDNERAWYRHHTLFADLLRNRLNERTDVDVRVLHGRASQWYQASHVPDEAISHALAALDYDRAADLLEGHARDKLIEGEVATVLGWMQRLPDSYLSGRPSLHLDYGWALLLSGRPVRAVETQVQQLSRAGAVDQQQLAGLEAYLAVLQGQTCQQGESLLESLRSLPPDDLFLRSLAAFSLGLSSLNLRDPALGSRVLSEAARMTEEAGDVLTSVLALYMQSRACLVRGELSSAQSMLQRALDKASGPGGRMPVSGLPLVGLGQVAWERNELERAKEYLTEGMGLADKYRGTMAVVEGQVTLVHVRWALGDKSGALAALEEAERFAAEVGSPLLTRYVRALRAELALRQGRLAEARQWAAEQDAILRTELADSSRGSGLLGALSQPLRFQTLMARIWLAGGEGERGLRLLADVLPAAERHGLNRTVIAAFVTAALAHQQRGALDRAVDSIGRALELAEPEGYARVFLDECPLISPLLYAAVERGMSATYASLLLSGCPELSEPVREREGTLQLESLTAREREVVHLLDEGLSNQEIADRLVISLSTVKGHTEKIFGKLGVRSRTQAVARARALGILADSSTRR